MFIPKGKGNTAVITFQIVFTPTKNFKICIYKYTKKTIVHVPDCSTSWADHENHQNDLLLFGMMAAKHRAVAGKMDIMKSSTGAAWMQIMQLRYDGTGDQPI